MRWLNAFAILVGIVAIWWMSTDVAAPADERPKVVESVDSGRPVAGLPDGGEEVLRRDAAVAPEHAPRTKPTSSARLRAGEEARLHAGFLVADASQALAQARTKAESGKPQDYQAFLRERYLLEKVIAVNKMIDEGDYVVLAADAPFPPIPHDHGVMARPQFVLDDRSVRDVWFLIDLQKHRAARVALEAAEEFAAHRLDERVVAFNAKPIGQRRKLIEQHDAATKALRNWPAERASEEAVEYRRQMLPPDFALDRNRWRVSKRLRRNH